MNSNAQEVFSSDELAQIQLVHEGELDYDDMSEGLNDKLYEYFLPEMPYGTAKARDGDPVEFIIAHLGELV